MCSVTWGATPPDSSGSRTTVIYCTRDERRDRPEALPPSVFAQGGVKTLAPVDPAGGGTWIWVNEHGLAATLLNFYDAVPPTNQSPTRSRGQLLKDLAASSTLPQLESTLDRQLSQHAFAPFWIIAWHALAPPQRWSWNGHRLATHNAGFESLPFSSSSWNTQPVLAERHALFASQFPTPPRQPNALRSFHLSTSTKGPEWGPLMTRSESRSVSLTQVTITASHMTLAYQARRHDADDAAFGPPHHAELRCQPLPASP